MNRSIRSVAATILVFGIGIGTAVAMGKTTVTTQITDEQVVGGSIICPKGPYGDGFSANFNSLIDQMPTVEAQAFLDKAGDFAGQSDVEIESRSTSGDVETVTAAGPLHDLASQLCTIAAQYL
ncbi:MAG: hypothetical protein ACE363_14250 [Alphaproteobacteria bacterium]